MEGFMKFISEQRALSLIEQAKHKLSATLTLSNFDMTTLPPLLAQLTRLQKLYVNSNKLSGALAELATLVNLRLLAVDYNELSSFPLGVCVLKNLTFLNLSHNPLHALPPEIGLLEKLEVLWLNRTHLKELPVEIGNLMELDTLGARGNSIKKLPEEICKLQNLRWLTLEENQIETVPTSFADLKELVHMNFNKNCFKELPNCLNTMKSLRFCFFKYNQIEKPSDESFLIDLYHLKRLDLCENPYSEKPESWSLDASADFLQMGPDIQCNDITLGFTFGLNAGDSSDDESWADSVPSTELDHSDGSDNEDGNQNIAFNNHLPGIAKFVGGIL